MSHLIDCEKYMKHNVAIIVFSKTPRPGMVKTRMIPDIGIDRSYQLYCDMFQQTLHTVTMLDSNIDIYIYCTPSKQHELFDLFQKKQNVYTKLQQGNDLGERMHNAFESTLNIYEKVVLVGCDCDELNQQILKQSIEALNDNDIVIGPATDGGYYLIGLKQANTSLFKNICWGSDAVLYETRQRVKQLDYKCFELPELTDIDTYSDLIKKDKYVNKYLS